MPAAPGIRPCRAAGRETLGRHRAGRRRVPGVRKPALHALHDRTGDGYAYRAELSAFVDEPLLSPHPVLRDELDLPGPWFETIRTNLSAIAATPTDRTAMRQEWISRAVPSTPATRHPRSHNGPARTATSTPPTSPPGPTILDWEGWGTAPQGLDAATPYASSLLQLNVAARVRAAFPLLGSPAGPTAEATVCAMPLQTVACGDNVTLEDQLRDWSEKLRCRCTAP
ncbi:hypothetical protein [Streptomyces mirabilis]